jgi:peptidoglycan/xylan/chitin deacetylase (PgdA/CDA1 family)
MNPDVLTVVNYQRIGPVDSQNLYYQPKLSVSPDDFEEQLDYLQKHYNIISVKDLVAWFSGEREMPDRAVMITIDDCYKDNFTYAYPVLKKRWLSALFMLATNHIGTGNPIYWDVIGYAIAHTTQDYLSVKYAGTFNWESREEQLNNVKPAVEAVRSLPGAQMPKAIDEIVHKLGVSIPKDAFDNLYLDWENVNEMVSEGIEFGSKTVDQPILTAIPLKQAETQIVESKQTIEKIIKRRVLAFSYPRGLPGDFSRDIMKLVYRAGYQVAFINAPGPEDYDSFPKRRYAIRRVSVRFEDSFPVFVAKLNGISQIREIIGQVPRLLFNQ